MRLEHFKDTQTGKYGFRNPETGEVAIAPKYDIVGRPDSFSVFYNEENDEKIDVRLEYDYFCGGLCLVGIINVEREKWYKSSYKYGYIDLTGKEVLPLIYDDATKFSEDLAAVKSGGKYGFIDKTGKTITPFQFSDAEYFWQGLAPVCLHDRCSWGIIDISGKTIVPFEYEYYDLVILSDCSDFYYEDLLYPGEVLIKAEQEDKIRFFNRKGEEVEPPLKIDYQYTDYEDETLVHIRAENGYYGIYNDVENKIIVLPKYDNIEEFTDGLARVELNGQYGVIDKTGKEVVPLPDNCGEELEQWRELKIHFKVDFHELPF